MPSRQAVVSHALFYLKLGFHVLPGHAVVAGRCTCGGGCKEGKEGKHSGPGWQSAGLHVYDVREGAGDDELEDHIGQSFSAHHGGLVYNLFHDLGRSLHRQRRLVVLDVDVKNGSQGEPSLVRLMGEVELPRTLTVVTPSGGRHHYFSLPDKVGPTRQTSPAYPGLELLRGSRCVPLPPSETLLGAYRQDDAFQDIAEAPEALLNLFKEKAGPVLPADYVDKIKRGNRNNASLELALAFKRVGLHPDVAKAHIKQLLEVDDRADPFSDGEIASVVRWAYDRPDDQVPISGAKFDMVGYLASHLTDRMAYLDGRWHVYDHGVWQQDEGEGRVYGHVTDAVRRMVERAREDFPVDVNDVDQRLRNEEVIERYQKYQDSHAMSGNQKKVLADLGSRLFVERDRLNFRLSTVNVPGSAVNLRTLEVGRPDPHDLFTIQTTGTYEPGYRTQFVDELVRGIFGEFADDMMALMGSTLYRDIISRRFYVIIGPPASGKSTFFELAKRAMGGYATEWRRGNILKTTAGQNDNHDSLYKLADKSVVFINEVSSKHRIDCALIKSIVGNTYIQTRPIREREQMVRIGARIIMVGNELPIFDDGDEAIEDRGRVIYAPGIRGRRDPKYMNRVASMDASVMSDLRAFLSWAIDAGHRWYESYLEGDDESFFSEGFLHGLEAEKTADSPADIFFANNLTAEEGSVVLTEDISMQYNRWAESNGYKSMHSQAFGSVLAAYVKKNIPGAYRAKTQGNTKRCYRNVILKKASAPPEDRF
jgi:phage/plasmid-associated DNA primase